MFSYEFYEISKNIFYYTIPLVAASDYPDEEVECKSDENIIWFNT